MGSERDARYRQRRKAVETYVAGVAFVFAFCAPRLCSPSLVLRTATVFCRGTPANSDFAALVVFSDPCQTDSLV